MKLLAPLIIIMEKILLVEDDPFFIDIYKKYFKKENYIMDVAMNKETALQKVKDNYPDLLVLDLNLDTNLPGPEQGLDILRTIRQDPKTKSLKVIVVSNYDIKDYPRLSELSRLGVIKTFLKVENTPDEILNNIKEILK